MYYRNANCAVVVYDITQPASLEKARTWIRELQRQADPSIVIALCGNKLDLAERRQVTQEEAKKYAEEEGLMWGETSAKSGEGVSDIFVSLGMCFYSFYIHRPSLCAMRECRILTQSHLLSQETSPDRASATSTWRWFCKGWGRPASSC